MSKKDEKPEERPELSDLTPEDILGSDRQRVNAPADIYAEYDAIREDIRKIQDRVKAIHDRPDRGEVDVTMLCFLAINDEEDIDANTASSGNTNTQLNLIANYFRRQPMAFMALVAGMGKLGI